MRKKDFDINDKKSLYELEKDLRHYFNICIKDAFKSEERECTENDLKFEFVMIKRKDGVDYTLYPFFNIKYDRVLRRINYCLSRNLFSNFGINYLNGENCSMHCSADCYRPEEDIIIDYNYSKVLLRDSTNPKYDKIIINISDQFNKKMNISGKYIPSFILYEKLWLSTKNVTDPDEDWLEEHEPLRISEEYLHDWQKFSELYFYTFGEELDSEYYIICSSGLTMEKRISQEDEREWKISDKEKHIAKNIIRKSTVVKTKTRGYVWIDTYYPYSNYVAPGYGYETMVFKSDSEGNKIGGGGLDISIYMNESEVIKGHDDMVKKWKNM